MLEHRRLAQAHEEAKRKERGDEGPEPHAGREGDDAVLALNDIIGRRVGQHEQEQHGKAEGPVHDRPRAELVGQVPAIGTEQRGRQAERGRRHARRAHVNAIDVDQVVRQPQRQRHEGAKDEEVVHREAPDLQVLQWRELLCKAGGLGPRPAPFDQRRVILGKDEEDHAHQRKGGGPDVGHALPAIGDHDEGGDELGHRSADVASPEDAQVPCPDGPRRTSG